MTLTLTRSKPKLKAPPATASQVITVFGPRGSTGKTSVALNLAFEFAELGKRTLLIDLDTQAPAIAQLLGLTNPTAAILGCARLIRQGRFNLEQLERLSVKVSSRSASFRVLTGLTSWSRWGELSEDSIMQLLTFARMEFDVIVIDVASDLDQTLNAANQVGSRNVAARCALQQSDYCLTLIHATEVSLSRYLNTFNELQELQKNRFLVLNRSETKPKIANVLRTLTKETIFAAIPDDQPSFELGETEHLPLALARRKSPARNAIALIAHKLLECPPSAS